MKTKLLLLVIILLPLVARAHDIEVKNADGVTIYYNFINGPYGTELYVTYRGNSSNSYDNEYTGNVVIPKSVIYNGKAYNVTGISAGAFRDCSGLTSITIPNSVTSIGSSAFYNCSGLTSVTLNSNAIVSKAYTPSNNIRYIFGTQVTEYIIGDEVTGIGNYAFYGCSGLPSVTIPNSVTSIGSGAFSGCSGLTSVTIPNRVTSIGAGAFYGCYGLTSVTIPNSVTSIGNDAFRGCSDLTSVTALNPNPVAITEYVFTNRRNATLYVPKGSKTAYQAAAFWKQFKEIVEIDVTGIKAVENEQIAGSDETGNWYTLDGRRLSGKPTKRGIYIVNGRKVIVN